MAEAGGGCAVASSPRQVELQEQPKKNPLCHIPGHASVEPFPFVLTISLHKTYPTHTTGPCARKAENEAGFPLDKDEGVDSNSLSRAPGWAPFVHIIGNVRPVTF